MLYKARTYASLTIAIFLCLLAAPSLAADTRGEVIRAEGCVHVVDASGDRQEVEQPGLAVREMDTIVTEAGGQAVIRFNDGALSVLSEQSRLRVEKTGWLSHIGGKIYFTFRKYLGGKRTIQTRFATLGIRGTTFIVYDDDHGQGVALQEGLLEIRSQGPAFEIHRQQQLDEFEQFKQGMLQQQQEIHQAFDDFRTELAEEFIEHSQEFTLQPNHVVRFDGARVDQGLIDEAIETDFDEFELMAGDLLEQFREQSGPQQEAMRPRQELEGDDYYE